ncbi:MAG: hypothetical protein MRERV_32c047 [Mycoplasmataceae bacterium RV_VA103A]|nr:MAG: hypothetical protein MRERV_32c047 [Mycoplasmataceae bacterium RV_VA103A]
MPYSVHEGILFISKKNIRSVFILITSGRIV